MLEDRKLDGGFPEIDLAQWEAGVEDALKGRPASSLRRTLPEGIEVAPLATSANAPAGTVTARSTPGPWGLRVVAHHPVVAEANRTLLDDLTRGASEVHVRFDLATRQGTGDARGVDGVAVLDQSALAALLEGVLLDLAPVSLDAGASFLAAGRALMALGAAARGELAGLLLGADPIGALAATGSLPQGMEQALADVATLAAEAHAAKGTLRAVAVDTSAFHDAGATEELDLAIAVATGVAYLRAMVAGGLTVGQAAAQIEFRLPVGVDQFVAIAKLRAFRRLWARVLEASGSLSSPALVHASLGASVLTRRDPWSNILRGTVACFAAGVGGADSVTIAPFDAALGLPGELGRRVGRNTQLVLQREAHLDAVADPAAGSHHVEALTEDLARAAWSTFQRIEHEGGMVAALVDGHIHDGIARRLAAREALVATRKRPITGVSEFALLDERLPDLVAVDPTAREHLPPSTFLPREGPWSHVESLQPASVAAPFEALRDVAESGTSRPTIASVNLGELARHTARATFAANVFAAGGIAAVDLDGVGSPAAAANSFTAQGSGPLVVVCGDDDQYDEMGADYVAALKAAGATVWVAGKPDDRLGADGFVHLGCDVVAVLEQALVALGMGASA